jgi:ATP-dependent Lon protease
MGRRKKIKDVAGPLRHAINFARPLVPVPLNDVRARLLCELPYAESLIDFVLGNLVGRTTVKLRPVLIVGAPGAASPDRGAPRNTPPKLQNCS